MNFFERRWFKGLAAIMLLAFFFLTAPDNHTEAEDVYDFALRVEQGGFAGQAGVNRVLGLPLFGMAYDAAAVAGYESRAFPFMVFMNRLLAVASLFLFYRLLGGATAVVSNAGAEAHPSGNNPKLTPTRLQTSSFQLPATLCLAFSYGFWRYANEAELYILAMTVLLGAWVLAIRGRRVWSIGVSALGVLIHLLNAVPLLLMIPFYYLVSRRWKWALIHGSAVSVLVATGYMLSADYLDWSALGAQHHALEAGLSPGNLLRAAAAFGQCIVSGNFLFGFTRVRELLAELFPSRMLVEEFYMAEHMPAWIPWVGCVTLTMFAVCGLGFAVRKLLWRKKAGFAPMANGERSKVIYYVSIAWLLLYGLAVIRTEAGSPELWIMALIPFWLLVASLLQSAGRSAHDRHRLLTRCAWILAGTLFVHNLIAGLLPIRSSASDYHAAKGAWLIENCASNDLVLSSNEPVMVFYLNYHLPCSIVNSAAYTKDEIEGLIASTDGQVYALDSFFRPLESMRIRSPEQYKKMRGIGLDFEPRFEKVQNDEFGGIYLLKDMEANDE